jgi:OPA family glycerol-3-phosphate transporter-like MFS transporter
MAEWTTPRNRGTVMAFWATCYQVGGMVATPLAGVLAVAYGWRAAFFGPAVLVSVVALAVLTLLKPGPSVVKAKAAAEELGVDQKTLSKNAQRAVLKNPVLWCYGASYFFVKFIRYALLFWLPYYLSTRLGYATDKAAWVATSFEAGGVLGVIVIGRLSDKVRLRRSAVSALSPGSRSRSSSTCCSAARARSRTSRCSGSLGRSCSVPTHCFRAPLLKMPADLTPQRWRRAS